MIRRERPTLRLLVSVVLGILLTSGRAAAQPPRAPEPAVDSTAEGRARFNEGIKLAEEGKHDAARLKFDQAWAVLKVPAVLYNLARSEQLSGHLADSLTHYRAFAKMSDPKIPDSQRQQAMHNILELSSKLGQIDIEAPPRARVSVDGRAVDMSTGDPIPVAPGKHVVEATVDGKVKTVKVECEPGTVATAKLGETKASDPAPPAPAAEPPTSSPPPRDPSSGDWTTSRIVTVSALSAGAIAGGVLALVFSGQAQDALDESRSLLRGASCVGVTSDACTRASELKDDYDSSNAAATVSAVTGVVLAAGAVSAVLFWPKTAKTGLAPVLAPTYGGLAGRF